MKDPDKVVSPTGNLVFINLRVEDPGCHAPSILLEDLPLDLGHGSAVEISVNESSSVRIAGLTHVVSCPIAVRMDWVSSSSCLPFNPLSRA